MTTTRVQVAIIGAGPSGLLLGQLLHKAGIDTIVLERQTGDYVLGRIRAGILELAGDAGHIVPPTGAKGLNLAATDVKYLSSALIEFYQDKTEAGIDGYSARCLKRIWKAERFSGWFTLLMQRFPDDGEIVAKFQEAELDYLLHSESGARTIAENYVGLPLDFGQ